MLVVIQGFKNNKFGVGKMEEKTDEVNMSSESYRMVLYRYLIVLSIGINILGAQIVPILNIPAFLDSTGTIFSAVIMGPIIGAFVGLLTNIVAGVAVDPIYFYYAPVNVIIGLSTGYIFKKNHFDLKTVFGASIVISILASVFGNATSYLLFAGSSGAQIDRLTQILLDRGLDLIIAMNITGFFANFLDKVISFALVFCIVGILEHNLKIKLIDIKW